MTPKERVRKMLNDSLIRSREDKQKARQAIEQRILQLSSTQETLDRLKVELAELDEDIAEINAQLGERG